MAGVLEIGLRILRVNSSHDRAYSPNLALTTPRTQLAIFHYAEPLETLFDSQTPGP
jgi:hypothetical protein